MKRTRSLLPPLAAMTIAFAAQASIQSENAKSADLDEARKLSAQVVTLYNAGKFDEALPLARRALEIRERLAGKEDALVADALNNLYTVLSAKGKYGEALKLALRAVEILEKIGNKGQLANQLTNLGWLYFADSDHGKARSCFERAMVIKESLYGQDDVRTADGLVALGDFYDRRADFGKASEFYRKGLEIKDKALGPRHAQVTALAKKCWCALKQNGASEEAGKMWRRTWPSAADTDSSPTRPTGGVLQGSAVRRVEPAYPTAAKNARISGAVIVEVTVDENGNVMKAEAICGPHLLRDSSETAARGWRFSATTVGGKPVKVIGTITFNFHL